MISTTHVQSPIEIWNRLSNCVDNIEPLKYHGYFETDGLAKIENTGNSAIITFTKRQKRPHISGGPLTKNKRYIFEQLHFHWAETDKSGCEHTIDGQTFSMEAHLVHYNEKYENFQQAIEKSDGLAVVAFFIQAMGDQDCAEFRKITEKLYHIRRPKEFYSLEPDCLSWLSLQELNKHYYTYRGSLTTSPYNECVTWIIYRTPIFISKQQVAAFRELGSCSMDKNKKILKNNRPIQNPPSNFKTRILFTRNIVRSKL